MKAPDAHSHTPPGADGWKNVLQLLKEQSKKMERLARALSVIRQGMLRNNPGHVKDSVSEASEVLRGMLNTHKCLLESGVEIQKRLESHPASKNMGIFQRLHSASLVRQSQEKRLLPRYASRWASQTSGTNAGCTNALAVCRQRWSV